MADSWDVAVSCTPLALEPVILFVDDEADMARALARDMREHGLGTAFATSRRDAIAMASERLFPVIAVDLQGLDGLSLIAELRELSPTTVFVIITGIPRLDLGRDRRIDAQILSIVPKPWDSDELAHTLHQALDLHQARSATGRRGRILVVDPDRAAAKALSAELERSGWNAGVAIADRLDAAIDRLEGDSFEAAIVDLALPDARGLDAIVRLRRVAPDMAVIVLSNDDDQALASKALQVGAQDFLVKGQVGWPTIIRALRFAGERERAATSLVQLAHTDQLTGLANRPSFDDCLAHAIKLARRRRDQIAVQFIDLDGFKAINDTLGHQAGDQLLEEVARRLENAVRESDTVARLGGDEFAIILEDVHSVECATIIADRVLDALEQPVELGDERAEISASIGVALFPDAGSTAEELVRAADRMMYRAKRAGGCRWVLHGGTARTRVSRPGDLELSNALRLGEFELHYQPQYAIDSGELVALEALLRWRRADGTLIAPGSFLPALEESGLIREVGHWALDEAARALASARAEGRGALRMAVNLSAPQFDDELAGFIGETLASHDLPADCLEIELTESVLMRDTPTARRAVDNLRELGVRLAIDDFGTGYSSLDYLRRSGFDVLKIDRSFVVEAASCQAASVLVGGIIDLGHRLDMEVVAEGIETPEQLELMRSHRCDLAQGFLLGHPARRSDRPLAA